MPPIAASTESAGSSVNTDATSPAVALYAASWLARVSSFSELNVVANELMMSPITHTQASVSTTCSTALTTPVMSGSRIV